jgi:predicted HTH domain antitoxin
MSSFMKTLELKIPDNIDFDDREAKMTVAARMYKKGKLTLGQASKLAGLSKITFMELLSDYDVEIINYSSNELDNDILNAKNYSI